MARGCEKTKPTKTNVVGTKCATKLRKTLTWSWRGLALVAIAGNLFASDNTWVAIDGSLFACENTWVAIDGSLVARENTWVAIAGSLFACEITWVAIAGCCVLEKPPSLKPEGERPPSPIP